MDPAERVPPRAYPAGRHAVITVAAAVLGSLLNSFTIRLYEGVTLHPGDVLPLSVTIAFGPVWGLIAAIPVSSVLAIRHGEVVAAIASVLAVLVIGASTRRRVAPMVSTIGYWTITGFLLFAGQSLWQLQPDASPFALIVTAALNGVLATMCADMLNTTPPAGTILRWAGRRRRRWPVRVLLLHGFVLISVLPLLAVGIIGGRAYAQRLEDDARTRMQSRATGLAADVDQHLHKHRQAIDMLARELDRTASLDRIASLDSLLATYGLTYRGFTSMLIADSSGTIVTAFRVAPNLDKRIGSKIQDRDYFRTPMATGKSYISGVFRGRVFGTDPIVAISAPVHDHHGRVIGIVQGALDPRRFGAFDRTETGSEMSGLIVADQMGHVVFSRASRGYDVLQSLDGDPLTEVINLPRGTRTTTYRRVDGEGLKGEPFVAAIATSPDAGWRVVVEQSLRSVRTDAEDFFVAVMGAMLAAMLIAFLVASAMASRVTQPLERLVRAIAGFQATGDTPSQVPVPGNSPREVLALVDHFEQMSARLVSQHAELRRSITDREQTNDELQQLLANLDDLVKTRTEALSAAMARAEEANEAKSRFLATMSHEIRTPLNGVVGVLEILLDGELNDVQRGRALLVRQSADALLALLNDILDYSKIEAGRLTLETRDFDLHELARGVTTLASAGVRNASVDVTIAIDPGTPQHVRGDPLRVRQVLLNLVGNAVKFTGEGSVQVRLRATSRSDSATALRFDVTDTGIGIPQERLQQLFERFSQADASTTRKFGGTGLGLAISRDLVHLMGGDIGAESELGRGSTFWFTLSLAPAEGPVDAVEVKTPIESVRAARKASVLIVDDNPVNRFVLEAMLSRQGHDSTQAADGAEAVRRAAEGVFDLILMDCQMPVMDGAEATRHIRQLEVVPGQGTRPNVPIIAVTAGGTTEERAACMDAGMNAIVIKPIKLEQLSALLDTWLKADDRVPTEL